MNGTRNLRMSKPIICILVLAGLTACGQATTIRATSTSALATATTSTVTPFLTNTNTPEPTPIPGIQVYPVSSLEKDIPWQPLDPDNRPMSVYYGFNFDRPPFNNVLVRQAFSAAVDREQIAQDAVHFKFREVTPATTLTPPKILGRDLYGAVGIKFDPVRAKSLLEQAGYASMESFPSVRLVVYTRGQAAPGAYFRMAETIAGMWESQLGIEVEIEVPGSVPEFRNRLLANTHDIYTLGWGADYIDPDNFLNTLFHTGSDSNYGHFSNRDYDQIVERAAGLSDPAERQLLYIQAEQILTEQEAAIIPLFHTLYYQNP